MDEKIGTVTGCVGGLYTVALDGGETEECKARGKFRHEGLRVLPGDRVALCYTMDGSAGIEKVFERKNFMIRPPLANLDILFCLASVSSPDVDTTTFDKLIVCAEAKGIEPVIIINKKDLSPEKSITLAENYKKCGFTVFLISALDDDGVCDVRNYLISVKDKLCAVSGASGVGKTSLLNRLLGDYRLEVGQLSEKTMRGKQTTRQCNLYSFSKLLNDTSASGYLADTPGFSMLDFLNFDFCTREELPSLFREFLPYIGKCRYTKCRHTKEDGCAVIEAVNSGIIPLSRHNSYLDIYDEVKDKHPWDKQ